MPSCLVWGEERSEECSQTSDEGYNECTATRDDGYRNCCDWWPCNWFCDAWVWISNIVCVAWTWVSNMVCVAWTWITTAVCVVWDIVVALVGAVLTLIESVLGWVLSAIAFVIEALEMIPVLGTIIRWVLNGITQVVGILASLGDSLLGLIGVRPEKKLRLCTVILRDEKNAPVATVAEAVALLQLAADVYKRDANVRILTSAPFKFTTGFGSAERVDESWVTVDGASSDSDTLDVSCDAGGEWVLGGTKFQAKVSTLCFFGSWRRVLGYGAPITCFIVREIIGSAIGCSLWITDYVTLEGSVLRPPSPSPRTLGHEVGHSCNLPHTCVDDDNQNIMATGGACNPASLTLSDRVNPTMNTAQALAVRLSKHVTYF